jgi:hypothetical protein
MQARQVEGANGFGFSPTARIYRFWREFSKIENAAAIKIAPFNRYQTLDVLRAVADSSRFESIILYTGNDDHIVFDLLAPYRFSTLNTLSIIGGLRGHWAVWTETAVEWCSRTRAAAKGGLASLDLETRAGGQR